MEQYSCQECGGFIQTIIRDKSLFAVYRSGFKNNCIAAFCCDAAAKKNDIYRS